MYNFYKQEINMTNETAVTQEVEDIVKSPEYEVVDEKAFNRIAKKVVSEHKTALEILAK
jgi:hypothetical protein